MQMIAADVSNLTTAGGVRLLVRAPDAEAAVDLLKAQASQQK